MNSSQYSSISPFRAADLQVEFFFVTGTVLTRCYKSFRCCYNWSWFHTHLTHCSELLITGSAEPFDFRKWPMNIFFINSESLC